MHDHQRSAMPNSPTFLDLFHAGYGAHILPVIPPGAPLSDRSRLDESKLGKTPGRFVGDGYSGLPAWPSYRMTLTEAEQLDRASTQAPVPTSISLQGRAFPAFDIDVDVPELAAKLKAAIIDAVGPAPARHTTQPGNGGFSARHALFYRSLEPLFSWVAKFHDPDGVAGQIEFKANKAQTLIEGQHKSGGRYAYPDGANLAQIGAANLTVIDSTAVESASGAIYAALVDAGCVVLQDRASQRGAAARSLRRVTAPSLSDVKAALDAAPNCDEIDRAEWVKVAHNVKGACVGLEEDGFELFADWAGEEFGPFENVESLWEGVPAVPETGWYELARWAKWRSNGAFVADIPDNDNLDMAVLREAAIDAMFKNQVWVENQEKVFDLSDRRLRNRQQFNCHLTEVGLPTLKGKCAWDVFLNEPDRPTPLHPTARRQSVFDMTYMPGSDLIVGEGAGRRVNTWRPAVGLPTVAVLEDEIQPWLAHVELLLPDAPIREAFLDWMSAILRYQDSKPNYGVVIGGRHGIGKSMLIEPLRVGFGMANVQEILASQLESQFSGWLGEAKLFVVEEMVSFNKKEAMQRLKSYLAAPPHTLPVNPKYGKTYTIPNLVAGMFFTNHPDAVAIEQGERRFFVIWSDAAARPKAYFEALAAWYEAGGAGLAAAWLLQRDVDKSVMTGEAPHTTARDEMRKASRTKLEELIENAIEEDQWPLSANVVALDDVRHWVTCQVGKHNAPSASRVRSALLAAKAVAISETTRFAIGKRPPGYTCDFPECSPKQARLFAIRDPARYLNLTNAETVLAFWNAREDAHHRLRQEVEAVRASEF